MEINGRKQPPQITPKRNSKQLLHLTHQIVIKKDIVEPTKEVDEIDVSTSWARMWRLLNEEERSILRVHSVIVHYKRNQMIYSEGDEPVEMMCLLKGKVKITKEGVGGRNQIIRKIRPIQYFAYRAYFAHEPYRTGATACEASTVCIIPMRIVELLIRNNSRLAMFFIRQLSTDLGIADERTVNLTQKHIRGRLADSLLFLKDSYGLEEDGATISIYLSREDLANLSNMTSSNATRTLASFADEQVIALDGRKIKLIDEDQLRKISDMRK